MELGAVLAPVVDPRHVVAGARAAEEAGLDAVSIWDHYHSLRPDWGYAAGWATWGAMAATTSRAALVPMVINLLQHDVGRLAKESSMLALLSGGRFELGIGAGDWPESFAAWGQPFPPAEDRLARLVETVAALRRLWSGQPVTMDGAAVVLRDAISSPPPVRPPRVVVGVGRSRRVLEAAVTIAEEVNVYPDPDLVRSARTVAGSGRVSIHADWSWDHWPDAPADELERWRDLGVDRAFVAIGGGDLADRIRRLADARP